MKKPNVLVLVDPQDARVLKTPVESQNWNTYWYVIDYAMLGARAKQIRELVKRNLLYDQHTILSSCQARAMAWEWHYGCHKRAKSEWEKNSIHCCLLEGVRAREPYPDAGSLVYDMNLVG
jgi:hypothetical protein